MNSNSNNSDEPAARDASHRGAVQVPYFAPRSPAASPRAHAHAQLPTISALPPIATARPLGNMNNTSSGSNIPVVNGVRQVPSSMPYVAASTNHPHYPPTIVNLSDAPSAAAPHLLPELLAPPFFEYMDKCRNVAGFMLCYYFCTFFFLQPFFLGTLGIMTGFLGYYGSRPPIYAAHIKWIRGYIWMNYSLAVLNVWYLAIYVFYYSSVSSLERDDQYDSTSASSATATTSYSYDEQQIGLFIGVVVAINMLFHFRGIQSAKHFHAEMLRAGPLPGQRTVVVLGSHIV